MRQGFKGRLNTVLESEPHGIYIFVTEKTY